jgi:hypothetical protein
LQFTGSDGWIIVIIIIIGNIYFLKGPTQPSPHTKPAQKLNATEMGSSIHRQAGRQGISTCCSDAELQTNFLSQQEK